MKFVDSISDGFTKLVEKHYINPLCVPCGSTIDVDYIDPLGESTRLVSQTAPKSTVINKLEIFYIKNVAGYENGYAVFFGKSI